MAEEGKGDDAGELGQEQDGFAEAPFDQEQQFSPADIKTMVLLQLIQAAADGHDEFANCIIENKDHITQDLLAAMHTYVSTQPQELMTEDEALRMSYFADEIGDVATDEYEWRVLLDELQILDRKQGA